MSEGNPEYTSFIFINQHQMDVKSCQRNFVLADVEKEQGPVEISPSGLAEEGNTVMSLSLGQTMVRLRSHLLSFFRRLYLLFAHVSSSLGNLPH